MAHRPFVSLGEREVALTQEERFYRYAPKGVFKIEYTVRYNNAGVFELPATRVEALYAPEMLGELPNRPVEVKEAP